MSATTASNSSNVNPARLIPVHLNLISRRSDDPEESVVGSKGQTCGAFGQAGNRIHPHRIV